MHQTGVKSVLTYVAEIRAERSQMKRALRMREMKVLSAGKMDIEISRNSH